MIAKIINLILFFVLVYATLQAENKVLQAIAITAALFVADNYWGDPYKK